MRQRIPKNTKLLSTSNSQLRNVKLIKQDQRLQSGHSTLLVPNPNGLIDLGNKYLSIADLACRRALKNCIDRGVHQIIRDDDFNFYLRKEIHRIFAPTI